ncbi:class I SAM-dependent methyltransferase [Paraflavitalea pollutisoli]|uniref:class I SAM-dependent methyltransferase n=1 Tax=Paraflavitalea pollutisoli TaxID=3034143 RepID=UPI0023EC648A|nr:class I SAM-dependent methyltransferase [Paraflavitalea sp. H1-2-19X]
MQFTDLVTTGLSYIRQAPKRKLIGYAYGLRRLKGLEIGGPSAQFSLRGLFPVYLFAGRIDGVNFSTNTVWEGAIREGETYRYHDKTGYQYVKEGSDLSGIADNSYDFLLSCHSLEHVANPLKALKEWNRVLKPGGILCLILPDKENTFDINRPYTSLQHLLQDFQNNTGEDDTTHFEEIIALHDVARDPGATTREEMMGYLQDNINNRRAHHHVFGLEVIAGLLQHASFDVQHQQKGQPFHLITIARKKGL